MIQIAPNAVLLFDGECAFCQQSVQFILKRESTNHIHFASLQSEAGQAMLATHGLPASLDSVAFIEQGQLYARSEAALRICRHLRGLWKLAGLLLFIPRPIRDAVYNAIARNRYRWFGRRRRSSCMLLTAEQRSRFLDRSPCT